MENLTGAFLVNAGWATALALVAAIGSRVWRHRPALVHGLWLLVLLKLATPSLVQLPAWWAAKPPEALPVVQPPASTIPAPNVVRPSEAIPARSMSRPSVDSSTKAGRIESVVSVSSGRAWPWRSFAVGIWIVGVAWWCSSVVLQAIRFRRLLQSARPAPEELQTRIRLLAGRLELRRTPSTWMVPARIPPMLWALLGPAKLLIPDELWEQLDDEQRETILVHELAHLRRHDHWVRRLEAVVLGLYWWDPVAWWARRELEESEEQCCDAWVSWALPEAAEAYALALVATASYLAGPRPPWPAGATGVGRIPPLKRRLSMILQATSGASIARPRVGRWLFLGVLALPLLPALARGVPPESGAEAVPPSSTDRPVVEAPSSKPAEAKTPGDQNAAPKPAAKEGEAAPPSAVPPSGDPEVIVVSPVVREVPESMQFTGRVEAIQTAEIRPQVGGMITRVAFQSGRLVKKGDLLFEIDSTSYQAQVKIAEAELRRATSRKRVAEVRLKYSENLKKRNMISHEDFARHEGDREEAEAAVDLATATLELAQLHLDQTKVTAPIAGRIGRPLLSEGNITVANTTPLATIISEDPLDVVCMVPTSVYRKLLSLKGKRPSGPDDQFDLDVTIAANEGVEDSIPARAHFVDFKVDPSTGNLRLTAVVPNPNHALVPGMQAIVLIETSAPEKALFIPAGSYDEIGPSYTVLVVNEQNQIQPRAVLLDHQRGYPGEVAVSSGLTTKDRVVVSPRQTLSLGSTVRPKVQESTQPR